jgi:hypothetical protein
MASTSTTERGLVKRSNSVRGRRDRGASTVEFALLLPILALLIFGIIDFGTTYNDYQQLRSGTRDGARDAVVTNYGTRTSCNLQAGTPAPSGAAINIICKVKEKVGNDNIRVGVWAPGGWVIGATLRVCSQQFASSTTGITGPFLNGKVMTVKVELRIEESLPTSPATTFGAGNELPLSSWPTSCTG